MTSFSLVVHALNKPLIFMVEITALCWGGTVSLGLLPLGGEGSQGGTAAAGWRGLGRRTACDSAWVSRHGGVGAAVFR